MACAESMMLRTLCILFCCFPSILWAQLEDAPTFRGMALGGFNFSQIDGDSYYGYHKVGLNIGAGVDIKLSNSISVALQILYSSKGSRGQTITTSPYVGQYVSKYYMDVNYIEVPVTLNLHNGKYIGELGACYARLIQSKESVLIDQPVVISPDLHYFEPKDVDLIFGLRRVINAHWMANFRWQYSLISIRPPERIPFGYSYGNQGQFNNHVSVRLYYVF
jgi:hypothetical protein